MVFKTVCYNVINLNQQALSTKKTICSITQHKNKTTPMSALTMFITFRSEIILIETDLWVHNEKQQSFVKDKDRLC